MAGLPDELHCSRNPITSAALPPARRKDNPNGIFKYYRGDMRLWIIEWSCLFDLETQWQERQMAQEPCPHHSCTTWEPPRSSPCAHCLPMAITAWHHSEEQTALEGAEGNASSMPIHVPAKNPFPKNLGSTMNSWTWFTWAGSREWKKPLKMLRWGCWAASRASSSASFAHTF